MTQRKEIRTVLKIVHILGQDLTGEYGTLEEVSFVSMKFRFEYGHVFPYYANIPKMLASLNYASRGSIANYFSKCCAFVNLLAVAPVGTPEHGELLKLESRVESMIKSGAILPPYTNAYIPASVHFKRYYGNQFQPLVPELQSDLLTTIGPIHIMVECFDDFCDVADIISVSPPSYFCLWFVGSLSPCSASRPEYQNDFSESISFHPDLTPTAPAFQWFNCSYWDWYNRHKNNSGVRLTLAENKRKFNYDFDAYPPNDSSDLVYFSNKFFSTFIAFHYR